MAFVHAGQLHDLPVERPHKSVRSTSASFRTQISIVVKCKIRNLHRNTILIQFGHVWSRYDSNALLHYTTNARIEVSD